MCALAAHERRMTRKIRRIRPPRREPRKWPILAFLLLDVPFRYAGVVAPPKSSHFRGSQLDAGSNPAPLKLTKNMRRATFFIYGQNQFRHYTGVS